MPEPARGIAPLNTRDHEDYEFWLVWNDDGCFSRFRHYSELSALLESQRLASSVPGKRFYVLKATALSMQIPLRTNVLLKRPEETDGVPF